MDRPAAIFLPEDPANLRDSGLLGLLAPQKYGGLGATRHEYTATARALLASAYLPSETL